MNTRLENKKVSVLAFCTLTVLLFFGCQTSLHLEETMNQPDLYDSYGARYYEPTMMRLPAIDPVAETYPGISPYVYVLDKPVCVDLKTDSLAKVLFTPIDSTVLKNVKSIR